MPPVLTVPRRLDSTALGLCVNARNIVPNAAECAELGVGPGDYLRTAVQGSLDLIPPMLDQIPADVLLMIALNNECHEVVWDWSGWEAALHKVVTIAQRYPGRIKIIGCGNELDIWYYQPPVGEPDLRLTWDFAAQLVLRAAPILRPAGIKVAMSSVASANWARYLQEMAWRCWWAADYGDLHLYAKVLNTIPYNSDWQTAEAAIAQAKGLTMGRPLICSEAGIKIADAGGLDQQAWWHIGLPGLDVELACAFAYHDLVGTDTEQGGQAFGAVAVDGTRKPMWDALQAVFQGPEGVVPPASPMAPQFRNGFLKWKRLEPALLGQPLMNEVNVWPYTQVLVTTTGVLTWIDGNFVLATPEPRVFKWHEDWASSIEVPV